VAKGHTYLLIVLIFTIACTSCKKAEVPVTGAANFDLTAEEIKVLEFKGLTNAEAAFKLAEYYSWARFDSNQMRLWTERAATGGHPVAQYNWGLQIEMTGGNVEESKKWFSLAAEKGVPGARERLKELERQKRP
jgi:TPR repeat protein